MIDTHAHLDFPGYDADRDDVIERCREKLEAVINIGIDLKTSRDVVGLAREHDFLYAATGVHPEDALKISSREFDEALEQFQEMIEQDHQNRGSQGHANKILAIGEIGLDYHLEIPITDEIKQTQRKCFIRQIEFAISHKLPIVIHSRDAFFDTVKILSEFVSESSFKGVWHSFTQGIESAKQVLDLGLYIGVNGIVTFPSANELRQAVKLIPDGRLLLETDAPFLAPQQVRGQRCEPWMVEWVADGVAPLKGLSKEQIIEQTDENVRQLFNLS